MAKIAMRIRLDDFAVRKQNDKAGKDEPYFGARPGGERRQGEPRALWATTEDPETDLRMFFY